VSEPLRILIVAALLTSAVGGVGAASWAVERLTPLNDRANWTTPRAVASVLLGIVAFGWAGMVLAWTVVVIVDSFGALS
jgi:hypothetical protein